MFANIILVLIFYLRLVLRCGWFNIISAKTIRDGKFYRKISNSHSFFFS